MKNLNLYIALALVALLAGCNTIRGMGEDIKAAGNGIENAASKKGGSSNSSKPSSNP